MSNFVQIPRQIKKFPIQGLDSYGSVYMAAICYSDWTSAVPTNKQLSLGEKKKCANFLVYISKTEGLVRIYIYRRIVSQFWRSISPKIW